MPEHLDPASVLFHQPPGAWDRLTAFLALKLALTGVPLDPDRTLPLGWRASAEVEGLRDVVPALPGDETRPVPGGEGVLVTTVRMGFGHHRIARSAYTWALALGAVPFLHDLLASDSPEAGAIRRMDATYSRLSRLGSELGGPLEWFWGRLMQQGGINALRLSCRIASALRPLMRAIPRDIPVVASYPLNGQIAVALGFDRVVNLVIDNHPQHAILVPGALNLVQGPRGHTKLLQMGMPADSVAVAGHWIPEDLARGAERASADRIARADACRPRRLLAPVGGAGAQRRFLLALLRGLRPRLAEGSIRLLLNAGDHRRMEAALLSAVQDMGLPLRRLSTLADVRALCASAPLAAPDPEALPAVVLCAFGSHFEAFTATDLLMAISDILVTKPSELAFFPIPKLHIRRVGNHEADSALRAAEIGDGTTECRTISDALAMAGLLCDSRDLFVRMNEDVARAAAHGVYDGSRVAIERALDPGGRA